MAPWGAKSWAHSDAHQAFTRAQELGEKLGETHQLVRALYGLAGATIARGQLSKSQALLERLLGLEEIGAERGLLCAANQLLGQSLWLRAKFAEAQKHLALASSYFEGTDPARLPADSIVSRAVTAHVVLHLGFPDRACQILNDALRLAERRGNLYSLAFVRMFGAVLYGRLRDFQALDEYAGELSRLTDQNPTYAGVADFWAGTVLLKLGKVEEGMARLRRGGAAQEKSGFRLHARCCLRPRPICPRVRDGLKMRSR